jgi:hypothetical protein
VGVFVAVRDPAQPGVSVELGSHDLEVNGVAVLPGGRVVSGSSNRRLRLWDPSRLGAPVELGDQRAGPSGWLGRRRPPGE